MFYGADFTTEMLLLLPDKVICFMTLRMVLDVLKMEQRWPLCIAVLHGSKSKFKASLNVKR